MPFVFAYNNYNMQGNRLNNKVNKPQEKPQQETNLLSLLSPPPIVFLKKAPHNPPPHHLYLTEQQVPIELRKILAQVENEMAKGEIVQATELLRKGKQIAKHCKQKLLNSVVFVNLAICYYKIGLLQQAFQELWVAQIGFKEAANSKKITIPSNWLQSNNEYYTSLSQRIKLKRIRGKISLQICILFSELGNHQLALKHSKIGSRIHFNLIYDTLILLYGIVLKYLNDSKYYKYTKEEEQQMQNWIELPEELDRVVNVISILNHLLETTKDLKHQLLSKYKEQIILQQEEALSKYGRLKCEVNIDSFMMDVQNYEWILKNKILNQVQMESLNKQQYTENLVLDIDNSDILEQITYMAVSFYCLSTEARFIEKNILKKNDAEIMDSEHWLSKSLEIAYSFLPPEAPILGQIYSVHNKFHGIDKQPIPEDKEMEGCVKILKPLRRPKSTYNAKTSLAAPILIRIQTPKTLASEQTKIQASFSVNKKPLTGNNLTIDLDSGSKKKVKSLGVPKKLEFLNSLQKIYKHQINKTSTTIPKIQPIRREINASIEKRKLFTPSESNRQSSLEARRPHSNQHLKLKKKEFESETIDVMQIQAEEPRVRKLPKNKNVDIQINNNINLFITNQIGRIEDQPNGVTIEYNQQKKDNNSRKMVVKLIQNNPSTKEVSKRSLYYGKKKTSTPLVQEAVTFLPEF